MTGPGDTDRCPAWRPLEGRTVVFGLTGGIAASKAVEYARGLRGLGARVVPVLTPAAVHFVTPLAVAALTGERARTDLLDSRDAAEVPHIRLAREADIVVVAPATADFMAKAAAGLADDLLGAVLLSTRAPVLFCPSMNPAMFDHPATRANIRRLESFGHQVLEPGEGGTACGEEGRGRLAAWPAFEDAVLACLAPKDLAGLAVLVTAGPTREPLDPVRYLSNRSSGRMGFAMARSARRRGADVTLVAGPTTEPPPPGIPCHRVETAAEMAERVFSLAPAADVIVMAAAVSDFAPSAPSDRKIKKSDTEHLELRLERTTDILADLSRRRRPGQTLVGFCAETHDLEAEAREKLRRKGLDLLVGNDVTDPESGFDVPTNRVVLVDPEERVEHLPLMPKTAVAEAVWDRIAALRRV
ncbi:bifunctional phosphopantothenoylcysteine decarboxylase/phosphopantothenate--cysteine ligase CoaBC [Dissulfurirhabdus thermomarina]|uniref:Coenzyme A biosynthesis bifunctional protein CoaBC n=1 Tax=Dissulfurirhabdus thermomarina TaxID=1765737 RepID=A0A6N9TJD6_DISTH|nr:bifunctional phosphopantothenoylcysteine decarboxylase/phosphopantothenate--cysteine ligase CoaBC [Dissulfurirhabdus thermomarina]NDY41371.1 bifunctional phosphopantothenoylcysteine decarboxylase/phosphopantothenate--cysteine ligase CoaBC [Dissulfurirhabdus thermomarina]NMX23613.1 bifunctional phosphopantothenoylcysteine decarboxylase/phosphopantothenate--cysteine ligase CoaBC [Dissulfurirhabdus thermomarina]